MNENAYAGRQYMMELKNHQVQFDVALIGNFPALNKIEEERCGSLWNPPPQEDLLQGLRIHRSVKLNSPEFIQLLNSEKYDLAIQGGTGIIRQELIDCFRNGILNFHPGDLPLYRGNSAPEWQILEGNNVISTCHLIDCGIDTGPVLRKKILEINKNSYHEMRASIYVETAKFVATLLVEICQDPHLLSQTVKQDESKAKYREYIGQQNIETLMKMFPIK